MPATRSKKKGSTKKSKAAETQNAEVAEEPQPIPQEDEMAVDSEVPAPGPSSSSKEGEGELSTSATTLKEAVSHVIEEAETVVEKAVEKVEDVVAAAGQFVEKMDGVESTSTSKEESRSQSAEVEGEGEESGSSKPKMTLEQRRAKMEELRKKMVAGTKANRQSLAEEAAKAKLNARELARLERQRKLAETLRLKADAEERGEDVERQKNWEYTIEENDEWEKKLARKKRRADYEFHDDGHAARRRYKKDLDHIKPDLEAYNRQKALATGLNPSGSTALTAFSSTEVGSSSAVRAVSSEEQRIAAENLYRDANTLIYGDNKPSEEAIDRVVGKINKDIEKKAKFHRKRVNEEEGDITYINEHNRVFNKKISRYYDKYTAEIRASFERGTAL